MREFGQRLDVGTSRDNTSKGRVKLIDQKLCDIDEAMGRKQGDAML